MKVIAALLCWVCLVRCFEPIFIGNQAVAVNGDGCVLQVPDQPLTPQGLMTPYLLMGPNCNQANTANSRFVHGVILNTDNGQMAIYNPLVVSQGMKVASPPAPVNFTANNHLVSLWLGSNSNFLVLANDAGIANGRCVTGPQGSPFGQFAWCNADNFWIAVNKLRELGKIPLPPLGMATDGKPCPTLRDFFVIDMDPDDGVQTLYLLTQMNHVIQKTQANMMKFQIKSTLANDGDNRLLTKFINPAIGCNTLTIPDLADPGMNRPALPLNVLQAMDFQSAPISLVPNNDPMLTTNNMPDLLKLDLYRFGVNQPQATVLGGDNDPKTFCLNYATVAPGRFKSLINQLKNFPSPAPSSPNLFQFMKARATTSYAALNCANLTGIADPFVAIN